MGLLATRPARNYVGLVGSSLTLLPAEGEADRLQEKAGEVIERLSVKSCFLSCVHRGWWYPLNGMECLRILHDSEKRRAMRNRAWIIPSASMLGLGVLAGCANLMPPSPFAPLLRADSADVSLIDALAHEQYTRVASCPVRKSCPKDHYLQGLIALFHNRERAVASFQQVRTLAPDSRLASVSSAWLDLLQANGSGPNFLTGQSAGVPKVTEDFVWEALERELDGPNVKVRSLFRDRAKRVGGMLDPSPVPTQDQTTSLKDTDQATKDKDHAALHAVQRRLQERERTLTERDRQINVLASQLEALKRIDQDTRERRPMSPAFIVKP